MPEFQMSGKDAPAFSELDDFTKGYIEAAFFTEEERLTEELGAEMPGVLLNLTTGESRFAGPSVPSFEMLAPKALAEMIADCQEFQKINAELLGKAYGAALGRYDATQAGHDFWLTRNGHGAGFWDRGLGHIGEALSEACGWRTQFPERSLIVGEDGKIYCEG